MRLPRPATALASAALATILGACAAVPIPHTVDLRAQMAQTTGTVTTPIEEGQADVVDLRLPTEDGACLDFSDTAPGATVQSAQLQWIVDATYDGPDLTGKLQARAYAAGAGDDVFASQNTLGPVVTINLDKTTTRLAGAANLNPNQLAAVNDREVCWGVWVTGEDVEALESGDAAIDYDVKQLRLRITFSII